jgi:hypothetical protein
MMNCTAAQHQGWSGEVYGDYMDGIESITLSEGCGFELDAFIKMKN